MLTKAWIPLNCKAPQSLATSATIPSANVYENGVVTISDTITALITHPLWVFLAVLARVSPILMLAPPTRSTTVPKRVRALLAVALAILIVPVAWPNAAAMPGSLLTMAIALACEALLGLLFGSVILLAITSMELAGQAIGHLAGFDMAESIDPNSEESMSVLASLLGWLAIAILLILGGHRQLISSCLESFHHYPAGNVRPEAFWLEELDDLMRHTLAVGIRAAAPVGTALLMANLITGLLARTLPQLNVLAVGFNINALALMVLMFVSTGSFAWIFQSELAVWIESMQHIAGAGRV